MTQVDPQSWSLRRLILFLALIAAGLFTFGVLKSCVDKGQEELLLAAVPGFTCPGLIVDTHKSHRSWSGKADYASSVLRMPADCRARLEHLVQSGLFSEDRCNSVERCWIRRMSGQRITLIFYRDYVSLAIESLY